MVKQETNSLNKLIFRLLLSSASIGTLAMSSFLLSGPSIDEPKLVYRQPASEVSLEAHVNGVPDDGNFERMVTLRLGCHNPKFPLKKLNSYSRHLRITGSICSKNKKIKSTFIENLSHRTHITSFNLDNNGFTSDYIDLVAGKNKIQISHQLTDGTTIKANVIVEKIDYLSSKAH